MKNINLLKNGKNAETVWANPDTQEIYPANKNSFGYNAKYISGDWFYKKFGKDMPLNQGKADPRKFYYSAKSMESAGFRLVKRGSNPLW